MTGKKYIFHRIKKAKTTITLNILHDPDNTEEIKHAYKPKYNLKRENQVILLMITDGKNGIILP